MPVTFSIGPPSVLETPGATTRVRGAVVALDSHDPGGCYPQVRGAELPHADEVCRDERVFEYDQHIQRRLGVSEHLVGSRRC